MSLWHQALEKNGVSKDWVEYLNYNRTETQAFLEKPTQKVDLIVPRGGEKLIEFVKAHASCPVIVSGRGNNFVYVHEKADTDLALKVKASPDSPKPSIFCTTTVTWAVLAKVSGANAIRLSARMIFFMSIWVKIIC